MSIPVATTTITVERSDADGTQDAYDGVTYAQVYTGVRAVIGSPSGSETHQGGSSEAQSARMDCDPIPLRHTDRVTDDQTGVTYEVTMTARRLGLGIDHTVADLIVVNDRASI